YRICTSFFCALGGFRMHITGKENYDKNQKYIIVANHRSLMDIPIFATFFTSRIIAKKNFFTQIPFFSTYYKKGNVLVDRKSRNSRSKSFEEMKKVLSQNISMAIYPEGTRNRGEESLLPFHNGAFKLAKETGVSILPVVLYNTDSAISPKKLFWAMPTVMKIHILKPISPNDFSTMESLRDNVKQGIKLEYEKMKNLIHK
ncbi:MAG: lysophospholipid acyltransferase family protein, partial [Chitinophagaceae bacterium]